MTRERMASSLARAPALRITCASPSERPANLAGSRRASIQVRMAKWRAGGMASLLFSPKVAAYLELDSRTSLRILLMVCSFSETDCMLSSPVGSLASLHKQKAHESDSWAREARTGDERVSRLTPRAHGRNNTYSGNRRGCSTELREVNDCWTGEA